MKPDTQANLAVPAVYTNDAASCHTSKMYDLKSLGHFTHRKGMALAYDFSVQPHISVVNLLIIRISIAYKKWINISNKFFLKHS